MKRILDILFAGMAIIVLLPILCFISIVLKITGEGKIFFVQSRVGMNGRNFGLLKFATMLENSPNIGTGSITIKNDYRVLPVGKFLRKSKLNELPQLWNILIGDMSVVGPRPMVPETFARYDLAAQRILNTVRPGLTGIGSVVFRNEERLLDGRDDPVAFYIEEIAPYKAKLEVWYVHHNTLWNYFALIFLTIWVVLFPSKELVFRVFSGLPKLPQSLH